jgi:hypothetical protein
VAGALCGLGRFEMANAGLFGVIGEARGGGRAVKARRWLARVALSAAAGLFLAGALLSACGGGMA